ncbi:Subunit of the glycosylphosphatidylinositol transamidase complex-like protein [Pleurotus pulmonarius]|nr:Subunit of the glycosylphosphatidylinositol transamidase complex-like protein [Pleurotus pulmonarius]KAF4580613.1 Subunit of the glycosylphosphatidylinositol transamidase complex-like protein [Pleurotus pulmonarius]KAF4580723.1 Subunit of the glycosylphosphatidylinositol transamidase complex-like protein [Pleurotus pulmonarius]
MTRVPAILLQIFATFFAGSCLAQASSPPSEEFSEELQIRPLRDGRVASTFSFRTFLHGATPRSPQSLGSDDKSQHYHVFPLPLGQILREYAVTELHLSMNAGKWNYEQWGYPGELGVATGAELWAWMGEGGTSTVDERWAGLRNALSGLFCASLASMDEQRTTSPVMAFVPEGDLPNWPGSHLLRHASLPSEHVCTENLTPFLKLLPCKSLSGIASLLNPHRLFDADWHGMSVHVLWHANQGVEVRLSFQLVSDPLRQSSSKRRDWSFRSLFDRSIDNRCPVARSSTIDVKLPVEEAYSLEPSPSSSDDGIGRYNLNVDGHLPSDIAMRWPSGFQYPLGSASVPLVPLALQRTLTGASQANGHLAVRVQNRLDEELRVVYLETMPWLVQFYVHTLSATVDGRKHAGLISNVSYIPPLHHSRPTTFQAILTLPPKSTVALSMDVSKAFLRYTDHQPDAQRGWDLPPAIFVPLRNGSDRIDAHSLGQRIYTPALLVDLATPDFSMPYNVIIFTCTVMAFIFGSVFNLLTRKFVVVHLDNQHKE